MTFLLVLSFSVLALKPTPGQEVKEAQCPGVPLQGGGAPPGGGSVLLSSSAEVPTTLYQPFAP